jgi:hypothetical protein
VETQEVCWKIGEKWKIEKKKKGQGEFRKGYTKAEF